VSVALWFKGYIPNIAYTLVRVKLVTVASDRMIVLSSFGHLISTTALNLNIPTNPVAICPYNRLSIQVTMSKVAANAPSSPAGVGARRKGGPKAIPRLPLSAFTPPNSGTGESFPLPLSPGTVHPEAVLDAGVITRDLESWKASLGSNLDKSISGVVLALDSADA